MRAFGIDKCLAWVAAMGAASVGFLACSSTDFTAGAERNDSGSVGLALQLAPGITVSTISYTIAGPGGFNKTGTVDVATSTTISAVIGGLPGGTGYTVQLTAVSIDGATSCSGSGAFDVTANMTSSVTVHLTCHEAAHTGSILVNGTLNVCPVIDSVSASPAEVMVGYPVALSVGAHDSDHGPSALAYHWTVSSGSLDDASSASPTFTCLYPGPVTVTVATSDGDPATSCAASASVTVTCSTAGPQVYAWVELGTGGQAIARLVTPSAACPAIDVDGVSTPMSLRIGGGTIAQRPTASTPALSKPSAFPVTTCELAIPSGAKSLVAAGRALPLPKAVPNRIAVIGDTGCRLKTGNPWQACSDPVEWPFHAIADAAAALAPDLVLHVGDYHYRENQCPPDVAGCQGSPWGYGWDVWEQDLFLPAAKLMAAAPWVVVRGNHEECARGGQGWYRFLDTLPYSAMRSCDVAANDDVANYNAPYAVPLGSDTQFIVFDTAKVGGAALNPANATDAPIFARYESQLQTVATLAANPNVFSIFTNHHPLLAYTSVAGANPIGGNPALLSVMSATYPGAYFPPNIKLVLEGHNHIFEAIDFSTPHPVQIITGNGGDNLDVNLPDPFPLGPASAGGDEPAPGVVADAIAHMSSFGFLILDRVAGGWKASEYRVDGTLMDTCNIDSGTDKIACEKQGFLH